MNLSTTQNFTIATQGGQSVTGSILEAGDTEIRIDKTFTGGSADVEYDVTFDASDVQSFVLVASQDMTIKTNNATTPGNTWPLKANMPFVWSKSSGYFANPISANVTKFFVTCASASRLQGKILTN